MKVTDWFEKLRTALSKNIQRRTVHRAVQQYKRELDVLYARAGRRMYEIYDRTHDCDPAIESLFAEIRRKRDALEDLQIDADTDGIPRVRCTPMHTRADASASVGAVCHCPRCGAVCLRNAQRCTGCGFILRRGA